jgi:hypothetical protein
MGKTYRGHMSVNHSDVLVTFQHKLLGSCKTKQACANNHDLAAEVHDVFFSVEFLGKINSVLDRCFVRVFMNPPILMGPDRCWTE